MEIDFENVLDKEPFNEETSEELFDNTDWISLSEYNADRVKKRLSSLKIRALNFCVKHCMIHCYYCYTMSGVLAVYYA